VPLLAVPHEVTCSACSATETMSLYLVVSTAQPPPPFVSDPLPELPGQQFHECGRCRAINVVVAPLVITNFGGHPSLLYVRMEQASDDENNTGITYVLERLRSGMGNEWRNEYLDDLAPLDRTQLPTLWQ
jgi:hypothetical protein